MADGGIVVHCDSLEQLTQLHGSKRKHLLDLEDKQEGQMTIHVEGHQYKAVRNQKGAVKVCRIDLEQDFSKRLPTVLGEFFSHRVADFFCGRGVGSRADKIASIIHNWVRFPDAQENLPSPPWMLSPTITCVSGTDKLVSSRESDYVKKHASNHCPKFINKVKLSKSVKEMDKKDHAWRRAAAQCFFPDASPDRALHTVPEFDMAACEKAIRGAFKAPTGDGAAHDAEIAALIAEMTQAVQPPQANDTDTPAPAAVLQARLLLLARALSANGRTPAQARVLLETLHTPGALHDLTDDSPVARQCWEASRLLAGTSFGFQMLCELVQPPSHLSPEAAEQWRTGLRLYLEASNHLIAEGKAEGKARLRAQIEGERQALQQRAAYLEEQLQSLKTAEIRQLGKALESESVEAERRATRSRILQEVQDLKSQHAALRLRAANLDAQLVSALQSWSACPLTAAAQARAIIAGSEQAKTNLLPHRTLQAAVKLMQQREVLDSDRLHAQYGNARNGADVDANVALAPDDVFALSVWRNGFRDDGPNTPLAEYAHRLNTMLVDMFPHDVVDETGKITNTVWKADSPFRVAFESDLASAVTRRTISQQAADFHAATGSLGRLLALKLKVGQGLPLEPYEKVIWDALTLRDALMATEAPSTIDSARGHAARELDRIIESTIAAGNAFELLKHPTSSTEVRYESDRDIASVLLDNEATLRAIRESLLIAVPEFTSALQATANTEIRAEAVQRMDIGHAVRAELLNCWLASTERSTRWKPWTITPNVRNAVIGRLRDVVDVQQHSEAIAKELNTFSQIDYEILQQWADEAGILMRGAEGTTTREINGRARRHLYVCAALARGQDKADAERLERVDGNIDRLRPHTRQEYCELMMHLMDLNLGCGVMGEISRNFGMQFGLSVDTGYALPVTGSLDASFSGTTTETTIVRGGITSSSIGSVVVQASEEKRSQQSTEFGIGAKAYGVSQSVDTGRSTMQSFEVGHGVRIAPTPGTRNWVDTGRSFLRVMLGSKVLALAEHDLTGEARAERTGFRALTELCWNGFQPLLDGRLAFNLFSSTRSTDTISIGASTGVSVSALGGFGKFSASVRLSAENDVVTRQSRVDITGSRRVAVHSIGAGSRLSIGLRFLLNLLPQSIAGRIHGSWFAGPVASVSATFHERGSQHAIRRETLHGTTQGNLAWDILFHSADDLVRHMNQKEIRDHWNEYKALRGDDPLADLDTALRTVIGHRGHCNQTYLVRRQLKADKLAEFNAMTALLDGLRDNGSHVYQLTDEHAIKDRCLALLTDVTSYEFVGFGLYSNDRQEEHTGTFGEIIKTSGEATAVGTEQEWKSARITPELRRKRAAQADSPNQPPQTGDAEGGRATAIAAASATAIPSLV
ncbi:hypothetical protein L602_002300000280 [Cupriavidus gilardii J11]|uniref:Uncharacterized protein n=1 Tax=Cupriavidus gilardii J11 TaxID=936133 RepID=A0A562BKH3_9BURK|nr:hypothetical protein [Cupriavidus gilardii]TWG85748.1 hypothetical protein L602_002300000280 [Cupriavidus gilardii J11]